jgi:thioesterase domain-containing protein
MVFPGYYRNEQATRAAFTHDGWFRTGDLGYIEHGRLRLVGRAKDSIIVSGVNYFSHEIEAAVGEIDGIERGFVAAFAHRPAGADTEQLAIAFAPEAQPPDAAALAELVNAVRNRTVLLWGFRPAVILPLSRNDFPKTSLGKIPRSLLRQRFEAGELIPLLTLPGPAIAPVRQLPHGEMETAIAQVFAEIFGRVIGATDSFFDLGGTSLEILNLKKILDQRFSLSDLPLVSLLQHSSVRALAALVARRGPPTYEPLVTLQASGPGTPLYCVHPGSGEVLVFVHLAARFAAERPVHALRARGLTEGEEPFGSFEEMVSTYTSAIRARQPHGPYALAGYSFGAPVAFEIARSLERAGERVAFLASIDGPVFMGNARAPMDGVECAVILAFFLGLIDRHQLQQLPRQLRDQSGDVHVQLLTRSSPERLARLDLTPERFKAWTRLSHALVRLGESYVPSGRTGKMCVFHAAPMAGSRAEWLTQLKCWEHFTGSPARYIEVSGEHHTLLDPEHVASVHAALSQELQRALQSS